MATSASPLRRLIEFIANEPVVHIGGTLSAAATWLFTYVFTGFNPSTHQQQIAGLATGLAYALSLIARQFVTPIRKVAQIPQPAPVLLDAPVAEPAVKEAPAQITPGRPDEPYPFDTAEAAQAALDTRQ